MNYVVTGGAGYLGFHLGKQLIKAGHQVLIFDDFSSGKRSRVQHLDQILTIDLTDCKALEELSLPYKIDGVFHLAARKSVSESELNPELYRLTNVTATQNILDFCVQREIKNIVFTSSAAVYGSLQKIEKITEKDKTIPINAYGTTKLLAEQLIESYVENLNLNAVALRAFNLAGTKEDASFDYSGENIFPIILRALTENTSFTVFGTDFPTPDGTCVRDYVHVDDVAIAHYLAMQKLEGNSNFGFMAINVASGKGTSVSNLLDKFEELSGKILVRVKGEKRAGDSASSVGDASLAFNILGWKSTIDITQMVTESSQSAKYAYEF